MKLYDLMLAVAESVCDTFTGTATGGTTTTLVDTAQRMKGGEFNNGTIFFTSGTYAGTYRQITNQSEGVITFAALPGAIISGVGYILADGQYFPTVRIKEAIYSSLREYNIPKVDVSLTYDSDAEYITLPADVNDLRRVEIDWSGSSPYQFVENHYWDDREFGKLYFKGGVDPSMDGNVIKLTHCVYHGAINDTQDVDPFVDIMRVKWESIVALYRKYFQRVKKDEPILQDLLAEAMQEKVKARQMAEYRHPLPGKAIRYNSLGSM